VVEPVGLRSIVEELPLLHAEVAHHADLLHRLSRNAGEHCRRDERRQQRHDGEPLRQKPEAAGGRLGRSAILVGQEADDGEAGEGHGSRSRQLRRS
jgi:hypothetical protein